MTTPRLVTARAELGRVLVRGARLQAEVQEAVTSASLGWSTTEVTQMSLSLEDPGFKLWHSGLFVLDTLVAYRPEGFAEELRLRIAAFDLDGGGSGLGGFTIKARSEIAWLLKRRRGALVMPNASASTFVASECRAVGAKVVAQPSPSRAQVARDVPDPASADDRGSEAPSSWTTFSRLAQEEGFLVYEFAGTVYFGKPSWLMTQLGGGLNVGWATAREDWNAMKCPSISLSEDAEVPVQISGIELRPHRVVEAAPGRKLIFHGIHPFVGTYLTTSLTMPMMGTENLSLSAETPHDPPKQPPGGETGQTVTSSGGSGGRGTMTMTAFLAGLRHHESSGSYTSRAQGSSSASGAYRYTDKRWARYGGYVRAYLAPAAVQDRRAREDAQRAYDRHGGDWEKVAASFYYPPWAGDKSRWDQVPGQQKIRAEDGSQVSASFYDQKLFLNQKVRFYVDSVMRHAWARLPSKPTAAATPRTAPGGKTAQAFVSMALSQAGKRYAYGAEASSRDASPSAFDCSELIEWALSRIGVEFPDGSANQIAATTPVTVAAALRTRGALLYQPGHIGISLGDGRSMEARNSRSGVGVFRASDIAWTRAGRIKGLQY